MGPPGTLGETEFSRQSDVPNGTGTMFKVGIVRMIKGSIQTIDIELFQNGKILGTLATNSLVLTLQITGGMILRFTDLEFTDGTRVAFGTVTTHVTVRRATNNAGC